MITTAMGKGKSLKKKKDDKILEWLREQRRKKAEEIERSYDVPGEREKEKKNARNKTE